MAHLHQWGVKAGKSCQCACGKLKQGWSLLHKPGR